MLGNQVKIAPIVDQLIAPLSPVDLARIEKICATAASVLTLDLQHLPDHARAEVRAEHTLEYVRTYGAHVERPIAGPECTR